MKAAKHNRCDALVLLLHPILQEATNLDEEKRRSLYELLHSRNNDGHTLLFLVSHHQKNLFLPHSMIMHLELQVRTYVVTGWLSKKLFLVEDQNFSISLLLDGI
jgi:ABC-type Mn2+/Zn2+ transport system ATPase subunit